MECIIFCQTCNKLLDTCEKGEDWAEEIAQLHITTRLSSFRHKVLIGYYFKVEEEKPTIRAKTQF